MAFTNFNFRAFSFSAKYAKIRPPQKKGGFTVARIFYFTGKSMLYRGVTVYEIALIFFLVIIMQKKKIH